MSKNILIRCDASKEIGMGHVVRCLVLARQFRLLGFHIVFAMKNYPLGLTKVKKENFIIDIASEYNFNYEVWLDYCVINYCIDIFIGDVRDGLPPKSIKSMKHKNIMTIAIDELSDYRKVCDLCFYPNKKGSDRLDWENFSGQIFQGYNYVLLREEFYQPFIKVENNIPHFLLMLGGTDPYNLTFPILKLLDEDPTNYQLSVILNTVHCDYKNIQNFINLSHKKIILHSNISNMSEFLNLIDFAIISYGVSAYELLTKKIPAIHICLNDEHWLASEEFENKSYAKRIYSSVINRKNLSLDFEQNIKWPTIKNSICEKVLEYF